MSDRSIFIRSDADQFVVSIDPALSDEPDRTFDTHKEARGYAGGLRLVKGGKLVDLTGLAPGVGMLGRRGK